MSAASELIALAERCEAATGADRELDLEIKAAIYGGVVLVSPFNAEWCLYRAGTTDPRGGKSFERPRNVPHEVWIADRYTASLDATMGLFPTGTMYRSGHDGAGPDPSRFFCDAITSAPGCHRFRSVADTEPLARTAAALRARAAATGDAS